MRREEEEVKPVKSLQDAYGLDASHKILLAIVGQRLDKL